MPSIGLGFPFGLQAQARKRYMDMGSGQNLLNNMFSFMPNVLKGARGRAPCRAFHEAIRRA